MSYALAGIPASVEEQRRTNARSWTAMYVAVLCTSAFLGLVALTAAPRPFALPFTMLVLASVVVAVQPRVGIFLIAFFTLFTDFSITPWFPFAKNMSSRESVLFVADQLSLSPLEVILAVTTIAWVMRLVIDRTSTRFVRGSLLVPIVAFAAFLFFGIVFGLGTGGDRYAAMWEFRPLLYLPLLYVLVTNLFTSRRDYVRLLVVMFVAEVAHTLLAFEVWSSLSADQRERTESLVDHGSAIHLGVILLVALAVWVLPKAPRGVRWIVLVAAIPAGWVFLVSERRAAVIGLAVAFLFLGVLLSKLNPRRLRIVGPVFLVLTVGYLGAFWNSESTIGFPAEAIKSVVAPDDASQTDRDSSLYRDIENVDILATIRAKPVTGFGFGHKFLRPVPLPDISVFPFYEYIPHNSILWIWIKMGVGGFVAMLFLFGSAIRAGVQSMLKLQSGRDLLLVFVATSYLVMYLVFAYVDIAWDIRSMVTVAVAMAICSEYAALSSRERVRMGQDSETSPRVLTGVS